MTHEMLLQTLMGAIGALGFAVLFNIRGRMLFYAFFGGALSWAVYLLTGGQSPNDLPNYLFASLTAAAYAEVLARALKTPVTGILVTSLIPLIPGGPLYYTMESCIKGDYADFSERGVYTISVAAMMALGIMAVMMVVRVYTSVKRRLKG